ncbi:MAG: hypothetical protein NHB14_12910 [Desulfosporosinus sp.]|nr:hypothetical protein [Desulfosporosinus sp.]
MALINYNRSILTNIVDTFSVVLTGVDQLILQFGLFVPQQQTLLNYWHRSVASDRPI